MAGRYICEQCGHRAEQAGDCPDHAGEPLQDLADADVRLMLDGFDAARKRKRMYLLGLGAFAVCSPLVFIIPFTKLAVAAWVGASAGLSGILIKALPPRAVLPDLEQEKPAWLKG